MVDEWSHHRSLLSTLIQTLGNAFRDYTSNISEEILPDNLRRLRREIRREHKVELPFVVDPAGNCPRW